MPSAASDTCCSNDTNAVSLDDSHTPEVTWMPLPAGGLFGGPWLPDEEQQAEEDPLPLRSFQEDPERASSHLSQSNPFECPITTINGCPITGMWT